MCGNSTPFVSVCLSPFESKVIRLVSLTLKPSVVCTFTIHARFRRMCCFVRTMHRFIYWKILNIIYSQTVKRELGGRSNLDQASKSKIQFFTPPQKLSPIQFSKTFNSTSNITNLIAPYFRYIFDLIDQFRWSISRIVIGYRPATSDAFDRFTLQCL